LRARLAQGLPKELAALVAPADDLATSYPQDTRIMPQKARGPALLVVPLLVACGPAPTASPSAPGQPAPEPGPEPAATTKAAGMPFYDAQGGDHVCMPPRQDCPPMAPDTQFTDACRLTGYRVQRCACEALCSGQVERKFYDASGQEKPCQPVADCSPPTASAAFQDACTERGHHLQECSCDEWLCSGDPTK
jgi:hypothetical protein